MTHKQQACITKNQDEHLINDKDKDLLNFVTKRIKLVYRINLPGKALKKISCLLNF